MPLGADADRGMRLDGAVCFARLPVPEPEFALAIPADHIAPVWREVGLACIPRRSVAL